MAMVLLIDGPLAGKLVPHENGKPIVHEDIHAEWSENLIESVFTQVVTRYTVYHYEAFGRVFHLGSRKPTAPDERTLNHLFWDRLASKAAKDASEPSSVLGPSTSTSADAGGWL
jgi:hypothetical protein